MKNDLTFSPVPAFRPLIRQSVTSHNPRAELAQAKVNEAQLVILTQAVTELQEKVAELMQASDPAPKANATAKGGKNANA